MPEPLTTETHHGTTERIGWSIEISDDTLDHPNGSVTTYGSDEARARADYERRGRAMHRGRTIRLVRRVTAEAWVTHADTVEQTVKPPPPPPPTANGAS
jgi:hypothetical protein